MTKEDVLEYVKEKYGTTAEYPWIKLPSYAVLRHKENKKWYALIMDIPKKYLGLSSGEVADVINLKCDSIMINSIIDGKVFFSAYHMNKAYWISALLENITNKEELFGLIDLSYELTMKKQKSV